jgi:hypothetical protein
MSIQSLRYSRIVHNATIFTISLFISFLSHIPFAFWVSATVLAIMLPLESTLIMDRIKAIFVGTVQGLILFIPIWVLMDINSGLIFIFIPVFFAAMNFYQVHNLARNIAFLNINLGIFLEYIQFGKHHFSFYLVSRFMTIIIGILVVWIGEILFTHRKNYGYQEFVASLEELSITIHTIYNYLLPVKPNQEPKQKINEHQLFIIHNMNHINNLATKINDNYNSILVEKSASMIDHIRQNFLRIPNLMTEYKIALLGIGYTLSEHNTSMNFEQIELRLGHIGNQILNDITRLIEV